MESIYWVLCWACHRRCKHCYDDRFRPYVRGALDGVVQEAADAMPKIVANLPDRLTFRDAEGNEKRSRIVMAGGEVLLDPVREHVLYPALDALIAKYGTRAEGGPDISIQTTGDLVTADSLVDLRKRNIRMVAIAGMDDFHVGMEGDKRLPLIDNLHTMFREAGYEPWQPGQGFGAWQKHDAPTYTFFGATPDQWIGKLWPRGRAWQNGLSTATMDDNFCNAWSGGLNFLNYGQAGSEVSIDPTGDVFPCCLKTKVPLGSLAEEKLTDILDSLKNHPVFEAINAGRPEEMGIGHGWSVETFFEKSRTVDPRGNAYANRCIGCDRFHEEVLGPVIGEMRRKRMSVPATTP